MDDKELANLIGIVVSRELTSKFDVFKMHLEEARRESEKHTIKFENLQIRLVEVSAGLTEIKNRLDRLNGSVAKHEESIQGMKATDTQLLSNVGMLLMDYNDRKADSRKRSLVIFEQIVKFTVPLFIGGGVAALLLK